MNFSALDVAGSALTAQRLRMDVISSNIANVNTTRQEDGTIGAFKRKQVVFSPILQDKMQANQSAQNDPTNVQWVNDRPVLKAGVSYTEPVKLSGVTVAGIVEDTATPTQKIYDPGHPDADENGYVEKPNINVVTEMVDMISASRAYEANITSIDTFKTMVNSALQI